MLSAEGAQGRHRKTACVERVALTRHESIKIDTSEKRPAFRSGLAESGAWGEAPLCIRRAPLLWFSPATGPYHFRSRRVGQQMLYSAQEVRKDGLSTDYSCITR